MSKVKAERALKYITVGITYTVSIFSVSIKNRFLPSNQTPTEKMETMCLVRKWLEPRA